MQVSVEVLCLVDSKQLTSVIRQATRHAAPTNDCIRKGDQHAANEETEEIDRSEAGKPGATPPRNTLPLPTPLLPIRPRFTSCKPRTATTSTSWKAPASSSWSPPPATSAPTASPTATTLTGS